ncbi:MAG: hypothetical protein V1696_01655 [Candidatus Jorgensenbacteria bacterium]
MKGPESLSPEEAKELSVAQETKNILNELVGIAHISEAEEAENIVQRLVEGLKERLVEAESNYGYSDRNMEALAGKLQEDITNSNEFFPNDFGKGEAVKEKMLLHLADYLAPVEELRDAA